MFLYNIVACEESVTLTNEKKFTNKELDRMCEKAVSTMLDYHTIDLISEYLIKNYGFKEIEYTATAYIGY